MKSDTNNTMEKKSISSVVVFSASLSLFFLFLASVSWLFSSSSIEFSSYADFISDLDSFLPLVEIASALIILTILAFLVNQFLKNGVASKSGSSFLERDKHHLIKKSSLALCVIHTSDFKERQVRSNLPSELTNQKMTYKFPKSRIFRKDITVSLKSSDACILVVGDKDPWERIHGDYYKILELDKPVFVIAKQGSKLPGKESHFPPKGSFSKVSHFSSIEEDFIIQVERYINEKLSKIA